MTVRQLVIGLPKSGKSTFIAALWALLTTPTAPTKLTLGRLKGDRERLNRLRGRYLRCLPMERTHGSEEGWVELELLGGPGPVSLLLPDLSGESFESQWRDRTCDARYRDAALAADGVVLCLHATSVREPTTIAAARALAAELRAIAAAGPTDEASKPPRDTRHGFGDGGETAVGADSADVASAPVVSTPKPWNPDKSPTQVQVVEILQFLTAPPLGPRPRRLAVVLSAWDLATAGKTPEDWLRDRFPLLDQYLATNADAFTTRVYGVSAQGGDLTPEGRAKLSQLTPNARIAVHRTGAGPSYDLTSILAWTLGA